MTKQIIDIGAQGNDGTGDSIRDSFRKVNDNFNEIYSIFKGGEGTIGFSDLSDGCDYGIGQIIVGSRSGGLTAKSFVEGAGIRIEQRIIQDSPSDPGLDAIVISLRSDAQLVNEEFPTLGAPLNAGLFTIGRLVSPSDQAVRDFNLVHDDQTTLDQLPVTVGFANTNYVRLTEDGIVGIPDANGIIVPGPVKARDEPTLPPIGNPNYDPTLTGNYLSNEVLPRVDAVYRGGDTMRGPLYLHDHPNNLAGTIGASSKEDLQAATAFYVDNKTFSSNVNLYVASSGNDLQLKTPAGREGRYWNYAFRSIGAALLHAESLISLASQEPGPYKQRISWTDGPDQTFSTIQTVALTGGNTVNNVENNNNSAGMIAAFNILQANRAFIQAETIAYINKKYVNKFEYDDTTFRKQISSLKLTATDHDSSLLTAIATDLWLGANGTENVNTEHFDITGIPGTNFNSQWAAISYLHRNNTNEGLIQWLSTIEFIKKQLLELSYATTELSAYIIQVINSLGYDLIYKSNYQSIQAGIAFSNAGTNLNATQLESMLTINPISIKSVAVTAEYITLKFATQISNVFPPYSHILINGTFTPETTGGDPFSLTSVEDDVIISYEVQVSSNYEIKIFNSSALVTDTYIVSNGSFDRKNLINMLLLRPDLNDTAKASFRSNAAIISKIVTDSVLPAVVMPKVYAPAAISSYDTVGRSSAKDLLLANIPFVQAEIIAFLSAEYSDVTYDRELCMRDVKYIIWSLAYDLMYSGNSQSVYVGRRFWDNDISNNVSNVNRAACAAAIAQVGELAEKIVENDSITKQYQQSVRQYRNDTLINGINAVNSIHTNILTINDILERNTTPAIQLPNSAAGTPDLITFFTALELDKSIYTVGTNSDVTTTASWYMDHFYPVINDPNYLERINALFVEIDTIIKSGELPTELPRYPVINVEVNSYVTGGTTQPLPNDWIFEARNRLDNAAITSIINDVNSYLDIDESITDVDVLAILAVDLRKLIISVCYDITYGGTAASVAAAHQMTIVSTPAITKTVISKTSLYARTIVNGHSADDSTNATSTLIGTKFTAAATAIDNDLYMGIPVDDTIFTGGTYIDAISLKVIINNNAEVIENTSIDYVNTAFGGGFNYDESLCYRDIGLIVDAAAIDIITGGNWQSITAGKSFYKNSSAKSVAIGTHYVQSFDGIAFAKNLGIEVLTGHTAVRYQQAETQLTAFSSTAILPSSSIGVVGSYLSEISDEATAIFTDSLDSVLDIIRYGVSFAATPSHGTAIWNIDIDNGGKGYVDQGAPKSNDIFPAKIIVGVGRVSTNLTASEAYASIVKYTPAISTGKDRIQVRLTKPGFFKVGEELEFGETVRDLNLSVFIESGIYYEDFPLKIPANVSVRGDEMRRTLIRPIDRESQSPWRRVFFYRDAIIDALEVGLIDYASNSAPVVSLGITATLDGVSGKIIITLSNNYQALLSWVGKVFTDNVIPAGGNKKRGKAVIDSVSGNTMNCTVIYPFETAFTKLAGNWFLFDTINYGRHYLTNPLDVTSPAKNNKEIDVFLCNEGNRIIGVTFQGQGGFAMVLDPEGNIKTKSPYIQECSSFSQSNNYKRFAGGQYIDGFAGRVYGTIKEITDLGLTIKVQGTTSAVGTYVSGGRLSTTMVVNNIVNIVGLKPGVKITGTGFESRQYVVSVTLPVAPSTNATVVLSAVADSTPSGKIVFGQSSGLDVRPPQPPCSFYVRGKRYQIDDIVEFNAATQTVTLTLDTTTPYMYNPISNNLVYDEVKAQRDAGYVIDAVVTDAILGTNYRAIHAGRAFLRPSSSLLIGELQGLTKAGIEKSIELANAEIPGLTLSSTLITSMLVNGVSATLDFVWASKTLNENKARDILQINKPFIKAEITAYISDNYVLSTLPNYNRQKSERDVGYLVDAITYDIFYGGNSQTVDYATSLFSKNSSNLYESVLLDGDVQSVYQTAYIRLRNILTSIVKGVEVTPTRGNKENQIQTLAADSTFDLTLTTLVNIVIDYVNSNPNVASTLPTVEWPTLPSNVNTTAYTGLGITGPTGIAKQVTDFLNNGADLTINLETGGNRSMLANDFAMFNDLGYGIVASNGAFTEQVCTFTYYAHTGFWANNGSNLRGVGCSNTFGNYGMRASGFDVTELPDSATLANHMLQTAKVYKQGETINEMVPTATTPAVAVWVHAYEYIPTTGSGLEIDHSANGGIITNYIITSVEYTTVRVNNIIVIKLNLSTSGDNNTASSGLAKSLYDGQVVSIRVLKNVKFNNIDNVKPTRPSTALQYNDNLNDVYRIVAYNLAESTGELLDPNIAILQSDNSFAYYNIMIDPTNIINGDPSNTITATVVSGSTSSTTIVVNNVAAGTTIAVGQTIVGIGFAGQIVQSVVAKTGVDAGKFEIVLTTVDPSLEAAPSVTPSGEVSFTNATQGYKVSDTKLAVIPITQIAVIDQLNKQTYITAWNGRIHQILQYVQPTAAVSRTCTSYVGNILTVSGTVGTINISDYFVVKNGTTITLTGYVDNVVINSEDPAIAVVTVRDAVGTAINNYSVTFGSTRNGYIEISSVPITNNSADDYTLPAMSYHSKALQDGSVVATVVTFDVPYNKDNVLPKVDGYLNIAVNDNALSDYNGSYQVVGVLDQTTLTISSTNGFKVGMVVTSAVESISSVGAIIQEVDIPNHTITVSPSCWVPAGSQIRASTAANVKTITVVNGGLGYPDGTTITIDGGGYTKQAKAVCKIVDTKIVEIKIVYRGSGYINIPDLNLHLPDELQPITPADLSVELSTPVYVDTTASEGVSVNRITVLYPTDPVESVNPGAEILGTTSTVLTSPLPTSSTNATGYSVTFQFNARATTLADNSWLKVEGNINALYNGFVRVISATATSATVFYPYNPGVFDIVDPTLITDTLASGTSSNLGISKPFSRSSSYTLKIGHQSTSLAQVTTRISTCRATGHDFCDIGTGGYSTTNIPYSIYGDPALPRNASHETLDEGVGRCFYVSTNQDGIFRVGRFFSVDQGTGTVTFSAKISLSNIEGFGFSRGVVVNEFSSDSSLTNNAADTVPVQSAVRGYIDKRLGLDHGGSAVPFSTWIGPGFLPLNGSLVMSGDLSMGNNAITNLKTPSLVPDIESNDAATKGYVDRLIASNNAISELGDVSITSATLVDAQLLVQRNTGLLGPNKWINSTLTGDVTIAYVVVGSTATLTSTIGAAKIVNSMVSLTADIDQSKLILVKAVARAASTNLQSDLGVSTYNSAVFKSTNGWIDLETGTSANGIDISKIKHVAAKKMLGNYTNATGAVTEVSTGDIVLDGDGIKNATFTSVGVMTVKTVVSSKATAYEVVPYTQVGGASSIVQTDTNGVINVKGLKVDGYTIIDTYNVDDTNPNRQVKFTTPGNVDFIVASGGAASSTNVAIAGTLDVTAATSVLKSKTLSTGDATTEGTIIGKWALSTNSRIDLTLGSSIMSATGITATATRPTIRPSVMFDFANSKTLDPRITFSRTSIATYYNSTGLLVVADPNCARFDHDPITRESKGLLLEEARTNYLTRSESFSSWTYPLMTRATSNTLTPYGIGFAYQFTANVANAELVFNDSTTGSGFKTFSIWIKRVTGVGAISYKFSTSMNWTVIDESTYDISSLVRLSFTESPPTNKISLQFASTDTTVVLWGAQLEDGKYMTSYIPTLATPVLRTVEDVNVTGTNFSSWYSKTQGTMVLSHTALGINDGFADYGGARIQTSPAVTSYIEVGCNSASGSIVYNSVCKTNTSTVQFDFAGYTTSTLNTIVTHAVSYGLNPATSPATYTFNNQPVAVDDSNFAAPIDVNMLKFGNGVGTQYITKFTYYAKQLSGNELLVLTMQ